MPRDNDRIVIRRKDGVSMIVSPRLSPFPRPAPPPRERVVLVSLERGEKVTWFCFGAMAMGAFVIAVGAVWMWVNG